MQTTFLNQVAPVALPVDFTEVDTFVTNLQRFNVLPFSKRCHLFISIFGENRGIELAETFDQYNFIFFTHMLKTDDKDGFYNLVLSLDTAFDA
jgi:hypothetical protein